MFIFYENGCKQISHTLCIPTGHSAMSLTAALNFDVDDWLCCAAYCLILTLTIEMELKEANGAKERFVSY